MDIRYVKLIELLDIYFLLLPMFDFQDSVSIKGLFLQEAG